MGCVCGAGVGDNLDNAQNWKTYISEMLQLVGED